MNGERGVEGGGPARTGADRRDAAGRTGPCGVAKRAGADRSGPEPTGGTPRGGPGRAASRSGPGPTGADRSRTEGRRGEDRAVRRREAGRDTWRSRIEGVAGRTKLPHRRGARGAAAEVAAMRTKVPSRSPPQPARGDFGPHSGLNCERAAEGATIVQKGPGAAASTCPGDGSRRASRGWTGPRGWTGRRGCTGQRRIHRPAADPPAGRGSTGRSRMHRPTADAPAARGCGRHGGSRLPHRPSPAA